MSSTHTSLATHSQHAASPSTMSPNAASWPGPLVPDNRSDEPQGGVTFLQRSTVRTRRLGMVLHHTPSGSASSRVQVRQLSGNTLGSTNDVVEHVAWTG